MSASAHRDLRAARARPGAGPPAPRARGQGSRACAGWASRPLLRGQGVSGLRLLEGQPSWPYWGENAMDIIRLPKGKPVAYLKLSNGWNGRVQSGFMLQGAMSGFSENGEYETVELAEAAARKHAEQRDAAFLIIADDT